MSSNQRSTLIAIILLLLAGNIFFSYQYVALKRANDQGRVAIELLNSRSKTLEFTKLFIQKVINATGEISFDTRLELENAVRSLNDKEVLNQWNAFVSSKTEEEAQENTKLLLNVLMKKCQ